jgi:uncharacterized protein
VIFLNIEFFDANTFIGRRNTGSYRPVMSSGELLKNMDDTGIARALVWHISQYDYSPVEGNMKLSSEISGKGRLFGCWTLLPPQTGELPVGDLFFEKMKNDRIYALRAFPERNRYLFRRAVFGEFLDRIAEKRIPLIFAVNTGVNGWAGIYDILEEYPDLRLIICNMGSWGSDRYFRPLLENYRNVCLEIGDLFASDGTLECIVKNYGSERLVFGSGFPDFVPEASMLCLLHADIAEADKRKIASSNLERMILEVRL